jgi:hypothetical protein
MRWLAIIVLASCISKPRQPARDIDANTDSSVDAPKQLRWTTIPSTMIDGRISPRLAWDVQNSRAVAFGGHAMTGDVDDLWQLTWSSPSWTVLSTVPVGGGTHYQPGFGYDPGRNALMLFGGLASDGLTFRAELSAFTGNSWGSLALGSMPSPRAGAAFAAANGNMYLFGGFNTGGGLGDVYSLPPSPGPWMTELGIPGAAIRSTGTAVTWDATNTRFLALTEPTAGGDADELWSFTPGSWKNVCTSCDSGGRQHASIVHMTTSNRTLLIGGATSGTPVAGTMILEGNHWVTFGDPMMPPARSYEGVVYDPVDDAVIVFGGLGVDCPQGCSDTFILAVQ